MTRTLLSLCLAASAGVHAGLAPAHGASFALAAGLLVLAAAGVVLRPGRDTGAAAALLLAGLLAAYGLSGENMDGVALATKAVEALGLLLAVRLAVVAPPRRRPERVATLLLAALIAVGAAAAAPAGTHEHAPGAVPHGH